MQLLLQNATNSTTNHRCKYTLSSPKTNPEWKALRGTQQFLQVAEKNLRPRLRLVHMIRYFVNATAFFNAFLWNCSHGAITICMYMCIDTYVCNLESHITIAHHTSQWHRMGVESIHMQHCTQKYITVTPSEQYHWYPHNPLHAIKKSQSHSEKIASCERAFRPGDKKWAWE